MCMMEIRLISWCLHPPMPWQRISSTCVKVTTDFVCFQESEMVTVSFLYVQVGVSDILQVKFQL